VSEWLSKARVAELATSPEGPGAPPYEDWRETAALAREVQEWRAEAREAAERLHAAREAKADRPIANLDFQPAEGYLVNPDPGCGQPAPTEGLMVTFDTEGNCGLMPIAFPDSRFVIGPAAARQLAELILERPVGHAVALKVKATMRINNPPEDP
jgi:hypothetical protein